jgi:hypothetical protein
MTRSFLICKFFTIGLFAIFVFFKTAEAQVFITQTQALSFGDFTMTDFSVPATVEIQTDGSVTTSANVFINTTPTRAEFSLTSNNFNTVYTVTTPSSVTLTGPGGDFTLDNFVVSPATLITSGAGDDDFWLTGRLTSQGGGVNYPSGAYSASFDITVAF